MLNNVAEGADPPEPTPRLTPFADYALRISGLGMVLASAVIGSGPVGLALAAVGLLLLALDRGLKHWPHKPAH